MGIAEPQTDRIELLRGLIDRLSDPDLTLAEAKDLRGRLSDLLGTGDRRDAMAATSALLPGSDRGLGPEFWSPDPPMRAAG